MARDTYEILGEVDWVKVFENRNEALRKLGEVSTDNTIYTFTQDGFEFMYQHNKPLDIIDWGKFIATSLELNGKLNFVALDDLSELPPIAEKLDF